MAENAASSFLSNFEKLVNHYSFTTISSFSLPSSSFRCNIFLLSSFSFFTSSKYIYLSHSLGTFAFFALSPLPISLSLCLYLPFYDLRVSFLSSGGDGVEEKRVAIIMGIQKKKKKQEKVRNELPAPIKGFYETDRRLDEEPLTEPSAQYVMPPPEFQQQGIQQNLMVDQMEQLASSSYPYPFFDYDDNNFGISRSGYNDLEYDSSPMSPPLIQYRQSYFPSEQVLYHLFKKK